MCSTRSDPSAANAVPRGHHWAVRRRGLRTAKPTFARFDRFPASSTALSSARYAPGPSGLFAIRPENVVPFAPAVARAANEPTRLKRLHFGLRAFGRAFARHLPWTLRPLVLRSIANVTVAASDSE
jgi:hypothetical protein